MSFDPQKDIYSKRVTIHPTITHKTLEIISCIALKKEIKITRVIEELIKESPTYKKNLEEMQKEGRFRT
jgi:hypothetical protein